jgi:hypothetical protein
MATKTAEKTNGTAQGESEHIASTVQLGPMFAGQGPYPGGVWSKFPKTPPPPPPCQGFWTAFRHFPSTGGIVAQLGAQPGTGAVVCYDYFGFQYVFTANVSGVHTITLTLNLGPVTSRPRGGQVYAYGLMQIALIPRTGGQYWYDLDTVSSNTAVTLSVSPTIQAGKKYILDFGVIPLVENAGNQSYGEIIVNSATLVERLPYGAQSAQAIRFEPAATSESIMALINPQKARSTQDVSLEQAVKQQMAEVS